MLTDVHIRAAKPRPRPYKLYDARGLYLFVSTTGARSWRFRYSFGGKEKLLALGLYPDVSLARARQKRDEARRLLAEGIDPAEQKQAARCAQADSFEAVAREWLDGQRKALEAETVDRYQSFLERWVLPYLGARPVRSIAAADLLPVLKRIEARGRHETAHRVRALCGRIFRYAVALGRAERDPSADLKDALAPVASRNFAAITDPVKVGALLRAIEGYQGQPSTLYALRLAPYVFVRPGELRAAEWSEFDLEAAEWRIPAARTKMKREHVVPLSRQAVAILREIQPLTGSGRYVFPSYNPSRPISENTLNGALRRLGYGKEEMTAHGFRAMASTLLNERGFPPDVIELQLAHVERNKTRAAYNRATRMAERRAMMQAWADYLDALKAGGTVVAIRRRARP